MKRQTPLLNNGLKTSRDLKNFYFIGTVSTVSRVLMPSNYLKLKFMLLKDAL